MGNIDGLNVDVEGLYEVTRTAVCILDNVVSLTQFHAEHVDNTFYNNDALVLASSAFLACSFLKNSIITMMKVMNWCLKLFLSSNVPWITYV